MQSQQQPNWCWAAVATSVAQFYNSATSWTEQCDLASAELVKSCCPAGSNAACDIPWYLDSALARVGHYNTYGTGPAPLPIIKTEIDNNRPLGVRVAWSGGGAHFVAISGYATSPGGDVVTIDDPIHARSTLLLSTFQSSYRGTGSWTHSYWTKP
jgi:hypothetical protein